MATDNETLGALHDGRLHAVVLEGDGVKLPCSTVDGTAVNISMSSVDDLYVNNFRKGNIILFVELVSSIDDLDELAIRGMAQTDREDLVESYRKKEREREVAKGIRYLVMQCSYGCDLVVAFRDGIVISS